jgi:hypothetical protein
VFNLLSEIVGTFVLVFVVFYFTNAEIVEEASPIGLGSLGALPVAFLVWGIGLSLGGTTGYAINPARDLGPRIAHAILPIKQKGSSDWKYAWIPIFGPLIGGAIAGLLFLILNTKMTELINDRSTPLKLFSIHFQRVSKLLDLSRSKKQNTQPGRQGFKKVAHTVAGAGVG